MLLLLCIELLFIIEPECMGFGDGDDIESAIAAPEVAKAAAKTSEAKRI